MIIPLSLLDPDTLIRLLEDFVTREGTDNGDDSLLSERVQRARHALDRGVAVIVYEPLSQQCQLMLRREVPKDLLEEWSEE